MDDDLIKFVRRKDYKLVRKLSRGGFGETVLLLDPEIDEHLVCKKYSPVSKDDQKPFFSNFVQEIKILYFLNHPNIVRVFNYYLYPELYTGYIMMEQIKGYDIEDHIRSKPEALNSLFKQAINGFAHLETNSVLHRDIRPQNILVGEDDQLKIIDFGFGKQINNTIDFDKSISLNWPFPPPNELKAGIYDFKTEVYFVGKLFDSIITENQLDHFQFGAALREMIIADPVKRIGSFNEIQTKISSNLIGDINFAESEINAYREFTNQLTGVVAKIEQSAKYSEDIERIVLRLEHSYQSVMLEEFVPKPNSLVQIFIGGNFKFYPQQSLDVENLRNFLRLLQKSDKTKKNIILRNLQTRLDSIERFSNKVIDLDDEVPF
jgi:eukaryotic-like serine/threonine-protein kinase